MPSLERSLAPDPYDFLPALPWFHLASDDMSDEAPIDARFAHPSVGGGGVSPHMRWSGHPAPTRGFCVSCLDPDAPTGSGYWHWMLAGLSGDTAELPTGASSVLPPGAYQERNDFGDAAYGGPAPPAGDRAHRYMFVVHAIDTDDLGVNATATPATVAFHLAFHTIARARLTVTFQVR